MTVKAGARLRVDLLGPSQLFVGGVPVEVAGPKRRAVLALLALAEGRAVTVDHLVEVLWPADGSGTGRAALQNHVSRLRRHLGPAVGRLATSPAAYQLELGADDLDVAQARTLLAAARACARDAPVRSYGLLRQAYDLWRGPMLTDLVDIAAIRAAVQGCQRLRCEVTEALVEAAVPAGEAAAVLDIAEASYVDDALREPAALGLMRVLAAVGRAPDALRIGAEFRRRLADETGLDPSPALGALMSEIARGSYEAPPTGARDSAATAIGGPRAAGGLAAAWSWPGAGGIALVGRDSTVAGLHRLLTAHRLVTVVGPGGVGKTRVALEVAKRSKPAAVLPLARLTDAAQLPHALAAVLDLPDVQGDVLAAAVNTLADRGGLLLIDNCEHLLDAARELVERVLVRCPQVTVLATSREPLGLPAEYVSRLAPLPLPGRDLAGEDLARVASVALFLDRARRVRPVAAATPVQLSMVADVVRRLDGIPLAIELAAGLLSTFSLADLRDRLDRALDLVGRTGGGTGRGGGADGAGDRRHTTLRATVEWSYALLSDDEQRLFRNLSVFGDGVDLATVERVGAELSLSTDPARVLARLVDASMVVADVTPRPCYWMLHLLRDFGVDRLAAAGEQDAAIERLLRREPANQCHSSLPTRRHGSVEAAMSVSGCSKSWSSRARRSAGTGPALLAGQADNGKRPTVAGATFRRNGALPRRRPRTPVRNLSTCLRHRIAEFTEHPPLAVRSAR